MSVDKAVKGGADLLNGEEEPSPTSNMSIESSSINNTNGQMNVINFNQNMNMQNFINNLFMQGVPITSSRSHRTPVTGNCHVQLDEC